MLDFSQSPESRYWRTVRGYPDYLVGFDGRIYSKPRQVTRWRAGSGRETLTKRIVAGHAGLYLADLFVVDEKVGAAREQQQCKCGKDEAHGIAGFGECVLKTYALCEENASANFFRPSPGGFLYAHSHP